MTYALTKQKIMIGEVVVFGLLVLFCAVTLLSFREDPVRTRTLLIEDLPKDATPVAHVHAHGEFELKNEVEERAEMQHYATEDAIRSGGPIYGVYGYRIVSIEYEIPVASIGERPVGESDPGNALSARILLLGKMVPYDHFHVGESESNFGEGMPRKIYRIHFMLISHEEEVESGLSCG